MSHAHIDTARSTQRSRTHRLVSHTLAVLGTLALGLPLAYSGNPHFVSCSLVQTAPQVCVDGKEAGLGDEDQITVTVEVTAHCQNPGEKNPKAANKATFVTNAQIPVQNGKALYELCVTPSFSPECSPPMTIIMDSVVVADETNGLSCVLQ
jgi:hypothetical protein